jgi:hypothetical protein
LQDHPLNLAEPFIVICGDKKTPSSTPYDDTNSVYFVNPTDEALLNVTEGVHGFFSDDTIGVVESLPNVKALGTVAPRSQILLEVTSDDEFAELDCSWSIAFEVASGLRSRLGFSAGKRRQSTTWVDDLPILGKGGLVVHRSR